MKSNIIIVGGGPIGLAAALSIKLLNPAINIITYEKYEEYQRKHTLRVQSDKQAALMKVSRAERVNELVQLLGRIKKDPSIRTSELEATYKNLAQKLGVDIRIEEIKEDNLVEKLRIQDEEDSEINLIIGADGTHSVINRSLFPEDNQVKYEFDYVLQLRYEIKGSSKPTAINTIDFVQTMSRHAFVANEYVGYHDGSMTPVTMQMMISKEDFEALRSATSKNPFKPYLDHDDASLHCDITHLPENISGFVNNYLEQKIKSCGANESIDKSSIRISVNEAPATCVKQVTTLWHNTPVLLLGDAALGLSYFKGLNAGLESVTQLISILSPIIEQLHNQAKLVEALNEYQQWFIESFAPKKIKEVERYSTWQIRFGMRAIECMHNIQELSGPGYGYDPQHLICDYFYLMASENEKKVYEQDKWGFYPHREHDPVTFGQVAKTGVDYPVKQIKKMFVDYMKPYKSDAHFFKDLRQPLVGLANLAVGTLKMVNGMASRDKEFFAEGILTACRGSLEIFTTPLAYIVKPVTRDLAGMFYDPALIETNVGIQSLSKKGLKLISEVDLANVSHSKIYELLAFCNDIHRKYEKSLKRGEATHVELQESSYFRGVRKNFHKNPSNLAFYAPHISQYFSLFQQASLGDQKEDKLIKYDAATFKKS
jgi:2-polyprenyl-6-methoxyphenol hydroxylase-like FAD-dependent oxidoreductase